MTNELTQAQANLLRHFSETGSFYEGRPGRGFHGTLRGLESKGYLELVVDGIHGTWTLTEKGREHLRQEARDREVRFLFGR